MHRLFAWLAAGSALAAVYHLAGVLGALSTDATPVWRHLLFVTIDSVGVWYLLRRPLALLPLYCLIYVQQLHSHGVRALRWWALDARIDYLSVGTLLALSVALGALVIDARDRSPRVRRLVCPFPAQTEA